MNVNEVFTEEQFKKEGFFFKEVIMTYDDNYKNFHYDVYENRNTSVYVDSRDSKIKAIIVNPFFLKHRRI